MRPRQIAALLALTLTPSLLAGCPRRGAGRGEALPPDAPVSVEVSDTALEVELENGKRATLGLSFFRPDHDGTRPAILFVPGGGNVSRRGTQPGDGARVYEAPVDVTALWAEAFANEGFLAAAYDKRTCTQKTDPRCRNNATADLDKKGPIALARDVDAACERVMAEPDFDGRLVLFAHGQAAAVALASSCAERAAALVLIAPIPRRVDRVMVDSLKHRAEELRREAKRRAGTPAAEALLTQANALKNKAASSEATFDSMRKGRFESDARVQGATIAFWQGWLALTERAADDIKRGTTPRVLVVGSDDAQYAPQDRAAILALAESENVIALQIERADHHLLVDERLSVTTVQAVKAALDEALREGEEPAL